VSNFSGITLSDGSGYELVRAALGESYDNIADGMWGVQNMYDEGKMPFVHVMFHPTRQPKATMERIALGYYDHLIEDYFMKVLSYVATGRKLVLVYLPEMNGNWTVYGQEEPANPTFFIAAYRHFVETGRSMGLGPENVKWCWAPNDKGWLTLEDWYPGDAWVDIVGMSAYNWGGLYPDGEWLSPRAILDPVVVEVSQFTKRPLVITQIASGLNDPRTPEWLDKLVTYANGPNIEGFIWFNIGEFALGQNTDWHGQTESLDHRRPDHWFIQEVYYCDESDDRT